MGEREKLGRASSKTMTVTGNLSVAGTLTVGGQTQVTGGPTKNIKVALAAVDTAGGIFAWQNPEAGTIIIKRVMISVTTIATGACTIAVGTTATNATTSSNNLMDALDVHSATGLFDNLLTPGTAGKAQQTLASGKWVTGSKASGASAGIVGSAYIEYFLA